ncbi:thioredoxin family protein [Siansivirga zeaxanthinifaciens]|uniref:Thioredoxin n=1 Tax=Siansivirga zeaxanthinifaciens CC-SAMT-1 TaxID=1454006 RepID=A0A0C5WDD9_9FLAO|nr:thioredoxin family protein [Siansivirga zeaxanthinifaciens]AJR04262.1 thioredoxin [Siansivirga zeaxanthinifaciens CC-SAMT-1]
MKLKHCIVFAFLAIASYYPLNAQESAETILKNASEVAKKEDKNIFVMFHASWCGWCKKMDKGMNDDACKAFFDANYVITHLTVKESPNNKHLENPGAEDLLIKYKGEKSGIPFWLIFNVEGELLADSFDDKGQNLGCPASKEEVEAFIKKLKNTSSLNERALSIIAEVFTMK